MLSVPNIGNFQDQQKCRFVHYLPNDFKNRLVGESLKINCENKFKMKIVDYCLHCGNTLWSRIL